jgi:hypothetical protein
MERFPDMTINGTKVLQATGIDDPGRVSGAGTRRPDPEVPERARRRTFTAKYKLEVLAAYDAAPDGEKGAVLRREGLYSSHIVDWRRARDAGRGHPRRRARHRARACGAGRVLRPGGVSGKVRCPPSAAARAHAARLRGEPEPGAGRVVDFAAYAAAVAPITGSVAGDPATGEQTR